MSVLCCQNVHVVCVPVLSRCCIFRQLLLKMFHLLAGGGGGVMMCMCVHVCLCVWAYAFRYQFCAVKMLHLLAASQLWRGGEGGGEGSDHVHMCTLIYVYVGVYGHMHTCITSVLSRCCIFRQLLVKMFHLLAGGVIMCACVR